MTGAPRTYAGLVLLVAVLVVLAVLGGRGGIASSTGDWPPEFMVNRIAIVGPDAQIRSYRPNGTGERLITDGDGFYTWPTWSPDGQRIVFSGIVDDDSGQPTATLFSYDGGTRRSEVVHASSPGFMGILAEGVVHYPLWSPDSSKLAFVVVAEEMGLSLFMDDVGEDSGPEFLLDEGPLWMSWASDSRKLLVHRGSDHFLVNTIDQFIVHAIELSSSAYRVPAWRPERDELTLSRQLGGAIFALYSAPFSQAGLFLPQPIMSVGPNAAFAWSGDGSHLAVVDGARPVIYQDDPIFVYQDLKVLDSTSFGLSSSVADNVVAFFWSPDGTKLAYVSLVDTQGGLRWSMLDVETGETSPLVDFLPSSDQMTMLQFFDQYAYSHRLWSPDSRFLLFSGVLNDAAVTVSFGVHPGHDGSHVYAVDTGPIRSVEPVAPGILGFWSPI